MNSVNHVITDLLPMPVTLAAYRYGYLYVVQGNTLLVIKGADVIRHDLNFTPHRFSSYGGLVAFAGHDGAAQVSGTGVVSQFTGTGVYSLPLAEIVRNGQPLTNHAAWKGLDIMGLPVEQMGQVTHSPFTRRTYYEPVLGAQLEHDSILSFQRTDKHFGLLNGVIGELLYADAQSLPEMLIPYSYRMQNLHGAGFHGGFVFTPDSGRSWRKRKLNGFGVLTEQAVLAVSMERGVELITGYWPGMIPLTTNLEFSRDSTYGANP